ncbi:stage II sporulation protein M [Paenibacillus sp. 481]|uniref:stage II sporulation protein M n=1 Tax=Paenibacillus sp. 481 TaxID=2835869 RepID=UPI001E32E23F|nr:stage II sporulation protein M [Paenibacillus sp. 481]UHA73827.1 stage II sporulation protein M [Paenibacillus sp. 481]
MVNWWRSFGLEQKNWIVFSLSIFIGGALLGYLFGNHAEVPSKSLEQPFQYGVYEIALNNIKAGAVIALSGVLLIFPPLLLLANGFMLGFIMQLSLANYTTETILIGLIPHGMFEIPALVLAATVGLTPVSWLFRYVRTRHPINWRHEGKKIGSIAVLITLLFTVASLMEVYVSPALLEWSHSITSQPPASIPFVPAVPTELPTTIGGQQSIIRSH